MPTTIPDEDFRERLQTVRERLDDTDADAAVWFDATAIEYLTGFFHIQTERPVVLAVFPDQVAITVPRLEVERVESTPRIDGVESYFDYPQGAPVETAAEMLASRGARAVLADSDGAPGVMGYEGPNLSEFLEVETQSWIAAARRDKSDVEVALVRESARWADRAHRELADRLAPGSHPVTVGEAASRDASQAMLDALGSEYEPRTRGAGPVTVGFISGEQTRLPHGHTADRELEAGGVLITGATANVGGYRAELERTMFVGEPDAEAARYFEHMLEAQDVALETLEPGVPLADVDAAVMSHLESVGLEDLARHHVGHAIGLEAHEPPYIDRGSDATARPGQLYTIEPGLYTAAAGYRHSDTVVVTESGTERLTTFPRELEANVVGQ
ncbi:MAG: M24 family metallopeptidase [Halodesulfurarchaeum sp.]